MVNRREFVALLGLGASTGIAPLQLAARRGDGGAIRESALQTNEAKAYGSGYFGEWITDQHGLPAYRYTCDQTRDPKAKTPVHKEWRSPTDQTHQVGNDRLVAAVSNYGYLQVRQDEGSPKFLNDYSPENNRYGAGFGYLTDGANSLSTYYPGGGDSFERILGAGYFGKTVLSKGYGVHQVIFAPFGDDPVVISQISITNHNNTAKRIRWIEYWGCHNYQFSYRSLMEAPVVGGMPKAAALRRQFCERFSHQFRALEHGEGLAESQKFLGRTPQEEQIWRGLQNYLKANPTTFFGPPLPELPVGSSMEDLNPPPTFLVSLDAPVDGFSTNGAAFFGSGNVEHPSGLAGKLGNDLGSTGPESALIVERGMELQPGETRTIYFMYGYLPEGFELAGLMKKYKTGVALLWRESSARWKADGLRFRTVSEPWVERETTWHNYYLRSNLTYDSFFREHILSQGHVYQYIMGFQGAARDPLQHALPFIFSRPEIVRETLRYTLKEIQPDGSIPYGIVGSGVPMPTIFHPSDLELWLLWLASEYVLATRDKAFLDEKVSTYPPHEAGTADETVRELLGRSYTHLVEGIGVGEHGLMRLLYGDWNDAVVVSPVPPEQLPQVRQHGESVLNAAMACYVLDHFARLLRYLGDTKMAAQAQAKAEAQRQAVRAQWSGRWFRRVWLNAQLGWLGEEQVWLEPQPWAILGGAATPEQSKVLVEAIDGLLRKPSPIGALYQNKGFAKTHMLGSPIGSSVNAGIWPSLNGTLIWALALVNGGLAWDEWKKNTLALHAEAYPDVWYGIWSGPDTYNSVLSNFPGQTAFAETDSEGKPLGDLGLNWTDFPVMNMHPHAWPLYSAAKLLGLEFNENGVAFAPSLPLAEYEFTSPLLGFKKSGKGYSGWYAPAQPGRWEIELRLPVDQAAPLKTVDVNGVRQALLKSPEGTMRFGGESELGNPLRWEISGHGG
jgi:hypothetical protein